MLILIAHGSKDAGWRASVEGVVAAVQSEVGERAVKLAYMECTPPTLSEVAGEAVRDGAKQITVLPLFLAEQGHVERNIRPMVDELRRTHRSVGIELALPVGQHALFRDLLCRIATDAGG